MTNSLLEMTGLPEFSKIKIEDIEPAIDYVLQENRSMLEQLLNQDDTYSWNSLVQPLEEMDDRLSKIWSPVSHMNAVVNSDDLREAYNACLPKLSEYGTEIGQNKRLYDAFQSIKASPEYPLLNQGQQTAIEHALREFRLSGVDLAEDKKQRYKQLSQRLSERSSKYEENVLDATNAWSKSVTDESLLSGLPASALSAARQAAEERDMQGWLFTLEFPSYHAIMTYADNRDLRKEVYRAFTTRASELGEHPEFDNSEIMQEILAIRHEMSLLLGYQNFAERSLEKKMAASPDEVLGFLKDLADKTGEQANREMEELRHFAVGVLQLGELQAWDIGYVSEKMKGAYYSLSQEALKPYFPVDRVIEGLFGLVNQLYHIKIKEKKDIDRWHPDVRFYEIYDASGELIAQFFFDLYARQKKRGGAWMDTCMNRMRTSKGLQIPVAYMTCNSSPPIGEKPALFTHDEVITLFHEFGHGLHHMLTRVDYPSISGISGVEWDAVELPSQFMENWCWEREALDLFAAHFETGEKLPEALFRKLIDSKNFQAAMQIRRQLEFAIFDMRIHLEYNAEENSNIQEILDEVRDQVAVVKPPEFNRFQNSFSHIFAGGYAAGYYSYKWAEVLSADAYARFEEEGLFNDAVGNDFLSNILEVGGSRSAMASYKAFRGREPSIDALLRHNGIAA